MAVPPTPSLKPECGIASYYHATLAGNPTANGETYDPALLTAAHNSLPFDTVVLVRRRPDEDGDGGETVTVRINDRGPFVEGRIIDLSPAAAKKVGIFGEDGVDDVCLVIMAAPQDQPR
ncbi:septal ring lytic transglycosylase RlpA family protein [Hyphococcus sp.]|uniref:septal ring lytic transglycosylase RlpA family protein n=1 Tax=Hyphococcus sp. TaxID=2038636 RepID=UPI0035C6C745